VGRSYRRLVAAAQIVVHEPKCFEVFDAHACGSLFERVEHDFVSGEKHTFVACRRSNTSV